MISVVVPVYNVERYVGKCIESILHQTYKDFELIVVNDGSKDKSLDVCESYAKKDSRVKIISKENGGLSDARNAGIDQCKGEYITFIDSDDYISPYMLEDLLAALIESDADISICSFQRVSENTQVCDCERKNRTELLRSDDCYKKIYSSQCDEFTVAWAKLYKSQLFANMRYPYGKLHEDEFVTYKLFDMANRVVYIDAKMYFYLIRPQSIMNSNFSEKSLVRLEAYEEREEFFKKNHRLQFAALTSQRFIEKALEYYLQMRVNEKDYKDEMKILRCRAQQKYSINSKAFLYDSLRMRLKVVLFCKCMPLFLAHDIFVRTGIWIKQKLMKIRKGHQV